jgi:hypothetical protein
MASRGNDEDICGELTEVRRTGLFEDLFPVLLIAAFLFGQLVSMMK